MAESLSEFDTLPPEIAAELQSQARRRKIMDAMAAQSQEPLKGQMVGRVFVPPHPLQGVAQMVNAGVAGYGGGKLDKQYAQTGQKYRDMQAEEIAKIRRTAEGVPGWTDPDNPTAPVTGGTPGDLQAAMADAMMNQFPVVREYGQTLEKREATKEQHAADNAARLHERILAIEAAKENQNLNREQRADLAKQAADLRRDLSAMITGNAELQAKVAMRGQDMAAERADKATGKVTEGQGKANLYQSRASEAHQIINDLEGSYSPLAIASKQKVGDTWIVGGALEGLGNKMLPEAEQKVEQAQRNFVNAILRLESGAVINPEEFANAQKQYFPQFGDSDAVKQQKKENRETAIRGLQKMAGPAMDDNAALEEALRVYSEP